MQEYTKPQAKTKIVLAYKLKHPNFSVRKVADGLKISYSSAYNCLYNYDALGEADTLGHLPELLGNTQAPEASDAPVDAKKPTQGQRVLRNLVAESSLSELVARTEKQNLHHKIDELELVIKALTTQNRGLENVIQYLEAKLGIDEIDARLESTRD